jgi:hypothetical protein
LLSKSVSKKKGIGTPLNTIFSWLIKKRVHQIDLFKKHPFEVQQESLQKLVDAAKNTEFGKNHNFQNISNLAEYQEAVSLQTYADILPDIERIKKGEQNILWPTEVLWFAKSSGTTEGKSKFIPVSKEALLDCHYKGGKDLLGMYYTHHPETQLFKGKHLIIGGSAEINYLNQKSYFGDLSSIIVKNLPWWCEWRRTPSRDIALMSEWEEKLEKMAKSTVKEDVHILAGVPSWTLVLLHKIMKQEGVDNIADVWPNIELYMHGGVNFEPYRKQFEAIIRKPGMNYVQTYNASEGFFGIQDKVAGDEMLLMLDYGIYYEFIPMSSFDEPDPKVVNLEQVELNINYALVISTNSGLWRYVIGDTVIFTDLDPFRFRISGRTSNFINAFGEELIADNTNRAIAIACEIHKLDVVNYTVCPIYMDNQGSGGAHQWLIEFVTNPKDLDVFIKTLDTELKKNNSDYEAKRSKDLSLQEPIVNCVPSGTFYEWMRLNNKIGGQNKIPRLQNDRKFAEEILNISTTINPH